MRAIFALLLTIALAGCFGGGDPSDPSEGDPTEVVALPQGLVMDDASIAAYTDTAVVWQWNSTVGPGISGQPQDPASTSTTFDVPAGVGLALEATLTWENDHVTDIGVRVQDAQGATVCSGTPPGSAAYPSTAPASACASWEEALGAQERWSVSAETYLSGDTETPFSVQLRLATRPSPDLAQVRELVPFDVEADDGTLLRGHVYLPDTEPPYATVLVLSGYWNTLYGQSPAYGNSDEQMVEQGDRTTLKGRLGWFMDAGFAVALVNIRGTGISDGCQDFAGDVDVADAGLVIETLADQTWSNGKVGMSGTSWPGTSVYTGIASGAAPLKAAAPAAATLDWWHDETMNGAPSGTPGQAVIYDGLGASPHPEAITQRYGCSDHLSHLQENLGYLETGDRTAWYEERGHREALNDTDVAVFAGYSMANAEYVPLRDHAFWERFPHENKSLVLGQWRHGIPVRADYWPNVMAWFDHHLRDGPEPDHTGVVRYRDSAGTWRTADRWPPSGERVVLHLSDGDLVASDGQVVASDSQFASTSRRALPDTCPDTTLFVSPPLAEDVVLAGVFQVNLTISSTLPDGDFAANLWHVQETWDCGTAPGLQGATSGSGTVAGPNPQEPYEVGFAISDLYHRGHLEIGRDFPTNEPDVMRMTSESFATSIPAGERIVLSVGGGDPLLIQDPRKPVLTVHTGPGLEGELVLNVVEGELAFDSDGEMYASSDQDAGQTLVEVGR